MGSSVAGEGSWNFYAAAGQGEDGLDAALAFGWLAFVKPAGFLAVVDAYNAEM